MHRKILILISLHLSIINFILNASNNPEARRTMQDQMPPLLQAIAHSANNKPNTLQSHRYQEIQKWIDETIASNTSPRPATPSPNTGL